MSGNDDEEEEKEYEDSVDSGKDEGQLVTNFDPQGDDGSVRTRCRHKRCMFLQNTFYCRTCSALEHVLL